VTPSPAFYGPIYGLSGSCRDSVIYGDNSLGKQAIALDVKINSLKKVLEII